jgi:hypothetical protein
MLRMYPVATATKIQSEVYMNGLPMRFVKSYKKTRDPILFVERGLINGLFGKITRRFSVIKSKHSLG